MEKIVVLKNLSSAINIDDGYWPIINNMVLILKEILQDNLLDLRLLGSVPRGDAIPGKSDIDFTAIIKEEVSQIVTTQIKVKSDELSCIYPIVSKIDINYITKKKIEEYFDYELILRTDSISIYGSDIYTVDKYSILNTELANLWNPNLDLILKEYREELLSGKLSNEEIKKYSRLTGKDIMKCLQRKILLEYGVWERSVYNMYNSLKEYIPEYSSLYDSLWDLYWLPTDDIERIILIIKQTELIKERYMQ